MVSPATVDEMRRAMLAYLDRVRKELNVTGPTFETIEVTPHMAQEWLEKYNSGNRRIRPALVDRYARDMRARRWHLTGAPVTFNGNGKLLDGQHRLLACVSAETSFTTVVARGIEATAMTVIDTGAGRTLGDLLRWRNERSVAQLSALIHFGWRYDRTLLKTTIQPSRDEALEWLDHNPGSRDAAQQANLWQSKIAIPYTGMAAPLFLTRRVDPDGADAFFEKLISGAELHEGSPLLAARRWVDRWAKKRDRPSTLIYAASLMKALNAWRSGRPMINVRWGFDEEFPRVWGED